MGNPEAMAISYILHARHRMEELDISDEAIERTLLRPDSIVEGRFARKIYQRRLNGQILRVIVEIEADIKRVITVYKARSTRYGI